MKSTLQAGVNPLNSTLSNWATLLDSKKIVCCMNKWLHPETNVIKGYRTVKVIKKEKKKKEVVATYLRKKEVVVYENKKLLDYSDAHRDIHNTCGRIGSLGRRGLI